MNKLICLFAFFLMLKLSGQELLSPSFTFSHKKTSYVTLKDGTEIKGTIKDLDRKKGLIEEVKIKTLEGKKKKLKAKEIKFMYLPPSGFDKVTTALSFSENIQRWNNQKLNEEFLNQGYVYFENSEVRIKKKNKELLMQLLNPTTSKVVKVYHDPYAGKTTSVGVAGFTVAGGIAKSYFFSVNDGVAHKIKKKNYDSEQKGIYGKCLKLIEDEHGDLVWRDLSKHLITFSSCISND